MMPLAPHLSLPAIGHNAATTAPDDMITTSRTSKPKLAFSIDSIVGRLGDNIRSNDTNRRSPPLPHKSRHSPHSCVGRQSSPPLNHRMSQMSSQSTQRLSPSNRSAANVSPMSTPSPISMANGSASSPYLTDSHRAHMQSLQQSVHSAQAHPHSIHHSPIGQASPLPHQMMMAAAAHHMPLPQQYHQAVALYPWLLRAHPFANRFHGMPFDGSLSSFLLPPFRKPKRIRTAFSPGQLLKLEQAFEKNHYVVGNERKGLASNLGLSETQVKVWFQNRRTKHKRQKQEEDEQQSGYSGGTGSSSGGDKREPKSGCGDESEPEESGDEEVDMDDNDDEDSGNELLINSDLRHHHLSWYQSIQSAQELSTHSSTAQPSAPHLSLPSLPSTSSTSS